ncbi:MAG: hypothetical protein ACYTGW_04515 [Planctomycetota bacterium]|jgi:hypothetical protein
MSTTKVSDAQAKEAASRSQPEDATAAFGFFRRHQKLIVYTAGIFTLLTFSITGAVMSVSQQWSEDLRLPTIQVPGKPDGVTITKEDGIVGSMIRKLKNFQDQGYDLLAVVPFVRTQESSDDPYRFAALRRLAIDTGVEVSEDDAQLAIEAAMRLTGAENVADLARMHGVQDPSMFTTIVGEALRISTFLRLAVLHTGVDGAEGVRSILKDNDEIGFQVADLDLDAIKKRLEKVKVTDSQLDAFMKELEEAEQSKYRHPTNRAAFELAFVGVGEFDPAAHKGELEGYEPGDAEIRNFYDRYKDDYFKVEPPKKKDGDKGEKKGGEDNKENDSKEKDNKEKESNAEKENDKAKEGEGGGNEQAPQQGPPAAADQDQTPPAQPVTDQEQDQDQAPTHRPFDEVKAGIVKKLQLKQVLRSWRKQLDGKVAEHMQPAFDRRYEATDALTKAQKEQDNAQKKVDESPDDKELEKALETAKKNVEAKEKAYEAADKAVEQRLLSFDFQKAVRELAKGQAVRFARVDEPKFAEDLKELPDDLGTWNGSFAATSVARSGEIHSSVQDVQKGAFLLRVTDLTERPYKEFAEIKDDLKVHYYTDKADKEGEEKKEKFEKALERLAKEKGKDEIAKIEKTQAEALEEKVKNWSENLQKEVEKYEADMAGYKEGDWAWGMLKAKRDAAQKKLEGAEDFRKKTAEELEAETKDEIKDIEKKQYKDVLAAAAKEGGFELVSVGPYTKQLEQTPRFDHDQSKLVQFLFERRELMDMKAGEATDILEDTTERRICLAVCTEVRKATSASITRRQWMAKQRGMTLFAMRRRMIDNPQLMFSLYNAFQRDQSLQPLQQLFFAALGGDKEKASELVNHPLFLPLLQRMAAGSAPFASSQKQLAANQSFTMQVLKDGYGWREPSAAAKPGKGAEGKTDSQPTSQPSDKDPKDPKDPKDK